MAGNITHNKLFMGVHSRLPLNVQKDFDLYIWNKHRILGQGHDLLFFYMFRHPHKIPSLLRDLRVIESKYIQKFAVRYINWLNEYNLNTHESLLFLYGYLAHHFLDAKVHPLIICETGDLLSCKKARDNHSYAEAKIDAWILREMGINPRSFRIESIISSNAKLTKETREVIRRSFYDTYLIEDFDKVFVNYNQDMKFFWKHLRHDSTGIKTRVFDLLDVPMKSVFTPSTLPFNFDGTEADEYLNLENKNWTHPIIGSIHNESFPELFNEAEGEITVMLGQLHEAIKDKATNEQIESIIPNVSSITGLHYTYRNIKYLKKS